MVAHKAYCFSENLFIQVHLNCWHNDTLDLQLLISSFITLFMTSGCVRSEEKAGETDSSVDDHKMVLLDIGLFVLGEWLEQEEATVHQV